MIAAKHIAELIVSQLNTDDDFSHTVYESPEPFRAMIYESGFVPNAAEIDGSDEYHAIVDELEKLTCG